MKVLKHASKHFFFFAILFLTLPLISFGQSSAKDLQQPNGISAGRPKIFDSRALTLMLETLNEQLRNVQVIDQKTLAGALGLQQGFSSTESVSNLTVSTLPVPSSKQEAVTKTGNVSSTGTPLPDTTQRTTTTNREAVVPQVPTLEGSASLPAGYNPSYGESAGDLLSDQVNLSYQIFNLRMLLERSLSDRLLASKSDSEGGQARLQAVLGVNITLDPPRTANDSVAVVEITVEATDADSTADGLSLVALMPQEKTYNAASVSTKSNSFGGSAVVKMIQVGYNQRKKSMVFYLYRDMDTIAYERTEGIGVNKNKVVFGWMFRPVLGRRSVSPGLRQMFAILALPTGDCAATLGSDQQEADCAARSHLLKASIKTYWKKYDRNTITSYKSTDANRARRFSFAASLGLNKPEIFQRRYENNVEYRDIAVRSTSFYEEALRAKVDRVSWRPSGAKTVVISVHGQNFFTDTKVSIGDKIYANPADGFYLKSTQSFDLTTTLDALASGSGTVLSRYGRAVPLVVHTPGGLRGIDIERIEMYSSLAGFRTCDIYLQARDRGPLKIPLDDLSKDVALPALPVVSVNNNAVPLPYTRFQEGNTTILQVNVPDSYLASGGGILKVSWPFLPPEEWTATWLLADPNLTFEVLRLSANAIAINRHDDMGFTKDPERPDNKPTIPYCWQLLAAESLNQLYTSVCPNGVQGPLGDSDKSGKMVSFRTKQDKDAIPDKVILIDPGGGTYKLDVPKAKTEDTSAVKPIVLKQYDASWIEIAGDDLTAAVSAEANGILLKVRAPKSASDAIPAKPADSKPVRVKTVEVEITREVTAKPGDVDLTILDKDGKPVDKVRRRLQITCVLCGEGGK